MSATDLLAGERTALTIERRLRQRLFAPVPRITPSQWADQYRRLSSEASAVPGRWTSFPFQREIMDAVVSGRYRRVVAMLPSQVGGKTEIPLNLIGYHVHLSPCPILMVEPTLEMARALSKDRIDPMFRDSPPLQGQLHLSGRRESDNTMLFKAGPGWRLTLVGSNSPAGLAMRPVRGTIFDEPDRYPPSAGIEGDVVALGEKRSTAFPNRWSYMGGTPTVKGVSRIAEEFDLSTQGKWTVPCPHCGFEQPLEWGGPDDPFGLKWDHDKPDTAAYLCAGCASLIPEEAKESMNAAGRYVHAHPERDVAGFHFTALVSPMVRWRRLVRDWLEAQGNQERIKTFVNTALARPYEMPGEKIDTNALESRRETYPTEIPVGVEIVTMGVDVQPDRLEATLWGWGLGEEAWILWHHRIRGTTADKNDGCWRDLEHIRSKPYRREDEADLRVRACCVDHGYNSAAVSDYVRPRQQAGVYAVKGSSEYGKPLVGAKPGRSAKYRVRLWLLGTDAGKDVLFNRLRRTLTAGPGYIHIPTADRADAEYLSQWANEKATTVIRNGRRFRVYRPVNDRAPVEAIDCGNYAYAGLWLLGTATRDRLGRAPKEATAEPETKTSELDTQAVEAPMSPAVIRRNRLHARPRGFVNNW